MVIAAGLGRRGGCDDSVSKPWPSGTARRQRRWHRLHRYRNWSNPLQIIQGWTFHHPPYQTAQHAGTGLCRGYSESPAATRGGAVTGRVQSSKYAIAGLAMTPWQMALVAELKSGQPGISLFQLVATALAVASAGQTVPAD